MAEMHAGLPVAGYQAQSADRVAIVNDHKMTEERILRAIERQWGDGLCDSRCAELAIINIQQAFMWLNRGIFRPGRVQLPEDEPSDAQPF